jgi:polysaccharide export outer membrane protein
MSNLKRFTQLIPALFLISLVSIEFALAESLSLGAGDTIRITVYGQPDLATTTRIPENGRITFPLIGDVAVGGISTSQAERKISEILGKRGLVRNAQVSIYLEERSRNLSNSITILGQVAHPGKYPLQEVSVEGVKTIVDLLAISGGTNEKAADYLYVIKNKGGRSVKSKIDLNALLKEGKIDNNAILEGGDVVLVPEMDVFYIYGQVARPGRYRLEPDMMVMQALSVAGGLTERGSEKGISLQRRDGEGRLRDVDINLADQLRAGDVLYVEEGFF